MSEQGYVEVLRALFLAAAGCSSVDGMIEWHKPALAGVSIIMARAAADASDALLTDEDVSISNLAASFDEFDWTHDQNMTWDDMEKLVKHLKAARDYGEDDADEQDDDCAVCA